MIENLLHEFINEVEANKIEVYNEFSLQHELGIFLRKNLKEYKIQFERNTNFFEIDKTIKHEIDIVIYNDTEKYAIELKYPTNGQYPETMYSFIKDICFMEQLKDSGFNSTYCFTMVNDKKFYSGRKKDGIYSFFRDNNTIKGQVIKPTGKKDGSIYVKNEYTINWEENEQELKYYIIKI